MYTNTLWHGVAKLLSAPASAVEQRTLQLARLLILLGLGAVFTYSFIAFDYSFWRPDTWHYMGSSHNEFEYNYRWLAPFFFYQLRPIPNYVAWGLAMALFWYCGYVVTRRHLRGSAADSRLVAGALGLLFILNAGIQDQFTWPTHALAGIIVFATLVGLARWIPRIPLVLAGTPLVFGVHQGFAFLTLLLLMPTHAEMAQLRRFRAAVKMIEALVWWMLAFLISWGLTKLILTVHFGQMPPLSPWRHPHPVTSMAGFMANLQFSIGVMREQFIQFYSVTGFTAGCGLILIAAIYITCRNRKSAPQLNVAILGLALYLSSYLITIPVGTDIPFRLTLLYGPASLIIALAFIGAARRPVLVLAATAALSAYPAMLALENMRWYAGYTTEVKEAVLEISADAPKHLSGVLIDGESFTIPDTGPGDHPDYLHGYPFVFFGARTPFAYTPVFYETGKGITFICGGTGSPWGCDNLKRPIAWSRCSTKLPAICSGGYSVNGFWIVRL